MLKIAAEGCCFEFAGDFYLQKKGLAMGSPLSPILAEVFGENLKMNL